MSETLNPLYATSPLTALEVGGVSPALFTGTDLLIGFSPSGVPLLSAVGPLRVAGGGMHLSLPGVRMAAKAGVLSGARSGCLPPLVGVAVVVCLLLWAPEVLRGRRRARTGLEQPTREAL
jgi:hypothetical protein